MNRNLFYVAAIAIITCSGCGPGPGEESYSSSGTVQLTPATEGQLEVKQEYETKMAKQIEDLQSKMSNMYQEMEEASGEAAVAVKAEMATLKERLAGLEGDFAKLQESSGEMWEKAKVEVDATWDSVSSSASEKMEQLKKSTADLAEKAKEKINETMQPDATPED